MTLFHNLQKLFSIEYQIETAPQQAIIDELQALRAELRALREDQKEPQLNEREQYIFDSLARAHRIDENLKRAGY